jgi:hypothetical protein
MSSPGLSYEQAPPFGAPLRFFLIAPVFLLLAAVLAVFLPDWQYNRWSPATLALTHLVTLGYLAMIMLGALLQILPVVLGAPVPQVRRIAWIGLLGLGLGTLALASGFLLSEPFLLQAAMLFLATGLTPVLIAILLSLTRTAAPQIAWPIRQAILALAVTLALGMLLAGGLGGVWEIGDIGKLTARHAAWGLIGWILILVIGVAYQVVPMLQLTPPYPIRLSRWLTWIVFAGLLLYTLPTAWNPGLALAGSGLIGLGGIAFAVTTMRLQAQRRRKIADITLDFWRLGMACLLLATVLASLLAALPLPDVWQEALQIELGMIFLLGFAHSVVSGMLYKIVPFLAWFHLKTQTNAKVGSIPNMKELLPEPLARQHYRLHLAMLLLLLPAPLLPASLLPAMAAIPGLLLLAIGAIRLWLNLRHAQQLFLRHGGRLD